MKRIGLKVMKPRFTLRTTLMACVLFAVVAWLGKMAYERTLEPPIVRQLRTAGNDFDWFNLRYKEAAPNSPAIASQQSGWRNSDVTVLSFDSVNNLDPIRQNTRALSHLTGIMIWKASDRMGSLDFLASIPSLEYVDCPRLMDSQLSFLAQIPRLKNLGISTATSEIGFVAQLQQLESILIHEAVDLDLSPLSELMGLKKIMIYGTVKNAQTLATLKQLESLSIRRCQLTTEEIEMLKRELPECRIKIETQRELPW